MVAAEVKSSTLDNRVLDECVRKRFLRMSFPPPAGGGMVVVSYPIVFTPAEERGGG